MKQFLLPWVSSTSVLEGAFFCRTVTQLKEERMDLGTELLASDMISSAYDNTDLETCILSLAYCTGEKWIEVKEENLKNREQRRKYMNRVEGNYKMGGN